VEPSLRTTQQWIDKRGSKLGGDWGLPLMLGHGWLRHGSRLVVFVFQEAPMKAAK